MKMIPKRFLQDPDWFQVEEAVLEFINPLLDINTVDTKAPAEHVKAEVLGRKMSYDALIVFVRESGLVREDKLKDLNLFR